MTFAQYQSRHLRKRKNEQLLLLGAFGMLCCLFVVALILVNGRSGDAIASESLETQPVAMGMVTLLAPNQEISAGTKLSQVQFHQVYWPEGQVPAGALTEANSGELNSLYAKSKLLARMPITREQLSNSGPTSTLPLETGYRAVTIPVDATAGLEGWALPGVRVDVSLTRSTNEGTSSQVIVPNAKVLSLNGRSSQPTLDPMNPLSTGTSPFATTASTITLQVEPTDALKIQTALQMGKLGLIMRAAGDVAGNGKTLVTEQEVAIGMTAPVRKAKKSNCQGGGSVRTGNQEYRVGCDGQLAQMVDTLDMF